VAFALGNQRQQMNDNTPIFMVMRLFAIENLILTQRVVLQMLYSFGNGCAIAFDIIITIGMSTLIPLSST
jgi:hypothetical protein